MHETQKFEDYRWHDNAIHGFRFVEGNDGCSGEFILDIDYILEWISPSGDDRSYAFKVAPATLTFYGVTDLVMSIDYASSSAAFQPMSIHEIERSTIEYPNGFSSYTWKIEINWPRNSYMLFQSNRFTQRLVSEPVITGAQYLSASQRKRRADV